MCIFRVTQTSGDEQWSVMYINSNALNISFELPYTRSENTVTSFYTEGTLYSLMQEPHTSSSAGTCHSAWGNLKQWQSCALTLCHGVSSLSLYVDTSVFSVFPSGSVWQIGLMGSSQDKHGQHRAKKVGCTAITQGPDRFMNLIQRL